MFVLVILLLCLSQPLIDAIPSVSFFFPKTLDESTCVDRHSWTKWFNSAHPKSKDDFDQELVAVIQQANGRDMCAVPEGIQAQSVTALIEGVQYAASWRKANGTIAAFVARTPGVDFQVRFCCANTDFITTTTPAPRPIANPTCGRTQIQPSLGRHRIFGGSEAIPHSWPWQVLYEEEKLCESNQTCVDSCGATLLDRYHVLTAAHCIGGKNLTKITLTAGIHNKANQEAETRQVRRAERIFLHPDWNSRTLANDLAIVRLTKPIEFNRYAQPACLPGPDPPTNSDVVLIGWGAEEFGGSPNNALKQARVKIIGQCYKYWSQFDEVNQLCAGQTISGDSACQGDSGGPLLQQYNGQWVVQGVASFIDECKTSGDLPPNVYIRVSAYLSWIEKTIR